jgi:Zn-finger nucleic acid-binding protein
VDRCGECSGVWLDAGELEKLAGSESTLLTDFFNMLRGRS